MKWGKVALVVFGAVIITALGIDAADTMRGAEGTLFSQVIKSSEGKCPDGMVAVEMVGTLSCIDAYEVSTGSSCPVREPASILDSTHNVDSASCVPESKGDTVPWRFVTREYAMQLCVRAGKRLPTSEEWYQLALGLSDTDSACNISSGAILKTGAKAQCTTPHGAFDLVGNVWEWVSDDVVHGEFEGQRLPESGYVAQVNASGMAVVSTSTEQGLFGGDYFWSRSDGLYGIIRGGYYDSGTDAGIYSVHADTLPTTAGTAIGFRCAV